MKRKSSFQEFNQDHDHQQLDESSQSSSRPRPPPQQPVSQSQTIPLGAAEHPPLSTAPWPYYQQYQLTQLPSADTAYYIPVPPPQSRMPGGYVPQPPSLNAPWPYYQQYQLTQPLSADAAYYIPVPPPQSRMPGGYVAQPPSSNAPWPYYQLPQPPSAAAAYYIPFPPPQSRIPGGAAALPSSSNAPTNQHQPPWPGNLSLLEELNKEAMNAKLTPSPPPSPPPQLPPHPPSPPPQRPPHPPSQPPPKRIPHPPPKRIPHPPPKRPPHPPPKRPPHPPLQPQQLPPHPPPSPPPYPWATKEVGNHRAGVRSLDDLRSNGITMISGRVICRFCNTQTTIKYNLLQRFSLLKNFIRRNKDAMTELREAPEAWNNPEEKLRRCMERDCGCGQNNALMPHNAVPPRSMNWLFMLLGQTLGLCTTDDLQYLVNERSDNKPRLLYLAFLSLCKQLKPDEPNFDL